MHACMYVQYSIVWYGIVWYGMVWCDVVRYCMVWCGVMWYDMTWYDMIWYDMIVIWYMTWYIISYSVSHRVWYMKWYIVWNMVWFRYDKGYGIGYDIWYDIWHDEIRNVMQCSAVQGNAMSGSVCMCMMIDHHTDHTCIYNYIQLYTHRCTNSQGSIANVCLSEDPESSQDCNRPRRQTIYIISDWELGLFP